MFSDPVEEEEGSSLDLKVLVLYGLFRSKTWVLFLTGLGLVGGLVVGASMPNEYQSEARLRYVPGERDKLTDDDLAGIENVDRRGAAPGITDEIMLLENPLIYQRVAAEVGPAKILDIPDPAEMDTDSTALPARVMHALQSYLLKLRKKTIVEDSPKAKTAAWQKLRASTQLLTVRNAATIRVLVRSYSPERAQELCGALVQAFQERHREVFSAEARLEDQRKKVAEAREAYQKAESEWNDYRSTCGVFDYEAERERNEAALQSIDEKLELHKTEMLKLKASIHRYQEHIATLEPLIDVYVEPVIGPNPEYQRLSEQRADLLAEKTLLVEGSLSTRQVELRREEIEKQLEKLQKVLDETPPVNTIIPARTERRTNEEYTQTQAQLLALQAELDGVIAEIDRLEESRKAKGEERERIAECKDSHFMHRTETENAKKDLEYQQEQLAKLEKLAIAEMKGASALKPYWEPTLPLTKSGPSRLGPLLAGIALGLALGMLLAILRQLLDSHLRYPETLERAFGLRVIGVVPESRRLRNLPKEQDQDAA